MSDISKEFFNFCCSYQCRHPDRQDYCPIADKVKSFFGVIHGGEECESIYREEIKYERQPTQKTLSV